MTALPKPLEPAAQDMIRDADLSPCGTYRWRLWRIWDSAQPLMVFVMLNPSTADARYDDQTVRRCIAFARAHRCGGIEIVNLYAFRARDPNNLTGHIKVHFRHVVGADNDAYIWSALKRSSIAICAWGAHPTVARRAPEVLDLFRRAEVQPMCLATTKGGEPSHPLYLAGALRARPYHREVGINE